MLHFFHILPYWYIYLLDVTCTLLLKKHQKNLSTSLCSHFWQYNTFWFNLFYLQSLTNGLKYLYFNTYYIHLIVMVIQLAHVCVFWAVALMNNVKIKLESFIWMLKLILVLRKISAAFGCSSVKDHFAIRLLWFFLHIGFKWLFLSLIQVK